VSECGLFLVDAERCSVRRDFTPGACSASRACCRNIPSLLPRPRRGHEPPGRKEADTRLGLAIPVTFYKNNDVKAPNLAHNGPQHNTKKADMLCAACRPEAGLPTLSLPTLWY
jgi:hypothetical protein